MASSSMLQHFQLTRNPYNDRTAEKTYMESSKIYLRSDLQEFFGELLLLRASRSPRPAPAIFRQPPPSQRAIAAMARPGSLLVLRVLRHAAAMR